MWHRVAFIPYHTVMQSRRRGPPPPYADTTPSKNLLSKKRTDKQVLTKSGRGVICGRVGLCGTAGCHSFGWGGVDGCPFLVEGARERETHTHTHIHTQTHVCKCKAARPWTHWAAFIGCRVRANSPRLHFNTVTLAVTVSIDKGTSAVNAVSLVRTGLLFPGKHFVSMSNTTIHLQMMRAGNKHTPVCVCVCVSLSFVFPAAFFPTAALRSPWSVNRLCITTWCGCTHTHTHINISV